VREHVVGGPRGDGVPRRREQRDHAGRDIKRKDGEARLIFFLVFVGCFIVLFLTIGERESAISFLRAWREKSSKESGESGKQEGEKSRVASGKKGMEETKRTVDVLVGADMLYCF
jgi:hypothetical protein